MSREVYKRDKQSDSDGMSLPDGKTCGDCWHFGRCNGIYGRISADEVCDWAPSRFQAKMEKEWIIQEYDVRTGKWVDRTSREHRLTRTEMIKKLDEFERSKPGAFRGHHVVNNEKHGEIRGETCSGQN